jgi:hypothetical protein
VIFLLVTDQHEGAVLIGRDTRVVRHRRSPAMPQGGFGSAVVPRIAMCHVTGRHRILVIPAEARPGRR